MVEKQRVVKVFNNYTYESSLFNELRAKRPVVREKSSVSTLIKDSKGGPFCKPEGLTPRDVFGRVRRESCVTASNIAKYDKWHGLVIFNNHDPLRFTQASVKDLVSAAKEWFSKAHSKDEEARYPFVAWHCLWRSAASIIHGHAQLLLARKRHYSFPEFLNKTRLRYAEEQGKDYFKEWFLNHEGIGLGLRSGGVRVVASITPKKEKEVVLLGDGLNQALARSVYKVLKTFRDRLGVESFTLSAALPGINDSEWEGFPVLVRIIDRGHLDEKTADIGAMELFANTSVVASDPYKVFKAVKEEF